MIHDNFVLSFNGKNLLKNDKEMNWERNIFQVTTSTDGHGSITASPMSGYQGTTVSLSNTPNANYNFTGYSVTGATLTGNQFTLNNDVTARAEFAILPKSRITYYRGTRLGYDSWRPDTRGRSELDLSATGYGTTAYVPTSTQKGIHITAARVSAYTPYSTITGVGVASSYDGPYLTAGGRDAVITGFDWVITGQIYGCIQDVNAEDYTYDVAKTWLSGYTVE